MEPRLNRALASNADILRALSRARFSSTNGGGLRSPKTSVWDRILQELFKKTRGLSVLEMVSFETETRTKFENNSVSKFCSTFLLTVKILDKCNAGVYNYSQAGGGEVL